MGIIYDILDVFLVVMVEVKPALKSILLYIRAGVMSASVCTCGDLGPRDGRLWLSLSFTGQHGGALYCVRHRSDMWICNPRSGPQNCDL